MGHDISPIGNHSLNTTDVASLARDLSNRLKVNVVYGFYGCKEHAQLLGAEQKDDYVWIELGRYDYYPNAPSFKLEDESYQLKQLYLKYGEELFRIPQFWIYYDDIPKEDDPRIDEERQSVKFPVYWAEDNSEGGFSYMMICRESYTNKMQYFGRWSQLVDVFMDFRYLYDMYYEEFLDYRRQLMTTTLALGGNCMYYVDDQSDILEGVGLGSEFDMTWEEIEVFLKQKANDLILDIPAFITDPLYRQLFLGKNKKPICFYDDFRDTI